VRAVAAGKDECKRLCRSNSCQLAILRRPKFFGGKARSNEIKHRVRMVRRGLQRIAQTIDCGF
jgi:hypothetical protein